MKSKSLLALREPLPFQKMDIMDYRLSAYQAINTIPECCKHCSNHPTNGGSGICHCILGLPKIT